MQKLPPTTPHPLTVDTAVVVGALLLLAGLVVLIFWPGGWRRRLGAAVAVVLGAMVAGWRRGREQVTEEPDTREEQDETIAGMDGVVESAGAGESVDSAALRAWARGGDDRGEP